MRGGHSSDRWFREKNRNEISSDSFTRQDFLFLFSMDLEIIWELTPLLDIMFCTQLTRNLRREYSKSGHIWQKNQWRISLNSRKCYHVQPHAALFRLHSFNQNPWYSNLGLWERGRMMKKESLASRMFWRRLLLPRHSTLPILKITYASSKVPTNNNNTGICTANTSEQNLQMFKNTLAN